EVITASGGSEWSGDRRAAGRGCVRWGTSGARHPSPAQLRCEGEARTGPLGGSGNGKLNSRRQETYDVVEIGLIINAGDPSLIWGARMRERDGCDDQKHQQHGAQAIGTRNMQPIENSHSRLVRS